jgi:hypothetical protein
MWQIIQIVDYLSVHNFFYINVDMCELDCQRFSALFCLLGGVACGECREDVVKQHFGGGGAVL